MKYAHIKCNRCLHSFNLDLKELEIKRTAKRLEFGGYVLKCPVCGLGEALEKIEEYGDSE